MKTINFALFVILFFMACGQEYNSNSFDETELREGFDDLPGDGDGGEDQKIFEAAYNVLVNNCVSCHTNYHNNYLSRNTSDDWINADRSYVIAGSYEGSEIIYRLNNYGGDMPQGGGNLSASDLEALREWIESL